MLVTLYSYLRDALCSQVIRQGRQFVSLTIAALLAQTSPN